MKSMNVAVLLMAFVVSARSEGFHNGPLTFGSDLAHPNGAKSYATITLGASGAINANAVPRTGIATSERSITYTQPQQITIERAAPAVHVVQAPSPQISVIRSAPQVSLLQSAAPQISLLQSAAPRVSVIQQAARPSISSVGTIGVSAGPASHGYTVNAPGLTKTATFGYSSGSSYAVSQPQISVSQAPQFQVRVPQQQIQLVQARAPQISVLQTPRVSVFERQAPQLRVIEAPAPQIQIQQTPAPQIRIQQAPAPQIRIQQAPAPQIRIQQAPAPQIRIQQQQQRVAVSGPATSHGYTVNAPGLTKTATFGYPSTSATITQSAPRITVAQQQAPRVQVRVAQPQLQVVQSPAPQIRIQQAAAPRLSFTQAAAPRIQIQQAPAPQIRIQQAPAARIRVEQPRVSVSGPATSHGYTVNAPGLTKTATFGYPSGGISVSQVSPRVTVQQAPRVQVRVARPQVQVVQAPAPQIRIQQAPAPQIRIQQAPAPQIRIQQAPAPQLQVYEAPAPQINVVQAPARQIRVQQQQAQVSVSGPATAHGYTVNAPGLTKSASFGYPSGGISVTQAAPRVTVSQTPKVQVRVAQPQYQYIQAENPQVHVVEAPQPRLSVVQAPAPQVSLLHQTVSPISTLTYGAPQISVVRTAQPQLQLVPASAPQISVVRSAQPQIQYVEAQPEVKTIQYEAPRVSASISGFSAPNVRQQQFNTPSHGYQVSAPGFTKHKTFAGPSVYGTHQDSGISGASGIGHVDLSLRQGLKSSA